MMIFQKFGCLLFKFDSLTKEEAFYIMRLNLRPQTQKQKFFLKNHYTHTHARARAYNFFIRKKILLDVFGYCPLINVLLAVYV